VIQELIITVKLNWTPWPESASELYQPSYRCLSVKLVPTFSALIMNSWTSCKVLVQFNRLFHTIALPSSRNGIALWNIYLATLPVQHACRMEFPCTITLLSAVRDFARHLSAFISYINSLLTFPSCLIFVRFSCWIYLKKRRLWKRNVFRHNSSNSIELNGRTA
jgi:hypothetical protein